MAAGWGPQLKRKPLGGNASPLTSQAPSGTIHAVFTHCSCGVDFEPTYTTLRIIPEALVKPRTFVGLLLILAANPALAQHKRLVAPFVGRGVELLSIRDGSRWTPGTTWQVGIHVQPRGSSWGVRALATYYDDSQALRTQAAGFAIEATRDLASGSTRPYLLAGGGANWLYLGSSVDRWSALASFGAGVQRHILGLWCYGEARYMWFASGEGWAPHILPVTFGIRF